MRDLFAAANVLVMSILLHVCYFFVEQTNWNIKLDEQCSYVYICICRRLESSKARNAENLRLENVQSPAYEELSRGENRQYAGLDVYSEVSAPPSSASTT